MVATAGLTFARTWAGRITSRTLRLHLLLDLCKDKVMPNGDATLPAQAMGQQTPVVILGNWREMRN